MWKKRLASAFRILLDLTVFAVFVATFIWILRMMWHGLEILNGQ